MIPRVRVDNTGGLPWQRGGGGGMGTFVSTRPDGYKMVNYGLL